jgi:hypothetical protein
VRGIEILILNRFAPRRTIEREKGQKNLELRMTLKETKNRSIKSGRIGRGTKRGIERKVQDCGLTWMHVCELFGYK